MTTIHCIATMQGGGAEKQFCYLLRGLKLRGIGCHAVIINGGVNLPLLIDSNIPIHYIKAKSFYDPNILFQLVKLFRKIKPDLVEVWQRPMDIFGGLAAIIAGIPFVAIERTDPMRFKDGIKYFLRKCITRKAKGLIANSNQGKTFWKNILSENIKIERLPNIIDFENISSVKPVYEESFIVYVGRIHEDKNVIQLINAFSHVVVNYSNLNLYIIGEGELINQCKLRVQELKINNSVKFLGYVNPPYEYIKSAGIFISLSSYEGMPNTVIEAAALQVPMLLSDIPQHLDLFGEDAAFYVNKNDEAGIAAQIQFILNPENSQLLELKKSVAYSALINNREEKVVNGYLNVYNEIIKN